jgi:CheY-like chemotaxis protein
MDQARRDDEDEPGDMRAMVVEDDATLRDAYSEALREYGHDVRAARDGSAALRILESGWTPGVVFLDLRMPGMDGWEFARRLRQNHQWDGTRLVIVAAHLQVEDEANKLGADAWLKKPFDLARLDEQARLAR